MWMSQNRAARWSARTCLLAFFIGFAATGQTAPPNSQTQILNHLNLVLRWARQWNSADLYLSRPGDEIYIENGRSLVQQVLKLEFQSALAQATLIGDTKPAGSGSTASSAVNPQNLSKILQRISQQLQDLQSQLDTVNRQLATAKAKERPALTTQRDTLQGQLQLAQALQDNLQKLNSFAATAESSSGAANELTGKILALQRSVPAGPATKDSKTDNPPPVIANTQDEGLIGQMNQMIRLMGSMRNLNQLEQDATHLQESTKQLRAPLLAALRQTLQQGQLQLANGSTNSTATPPVAANAAAPALLAESPAEKQRAMNALIEHFKVLSNATLPLSQELILIDQTQANLTQLQSSIKHDYLAILRSLLLRVAGLLIALGIIWLLSELWRRATFRYVRDARRRRQFLVLRRVVMGFCMFVVVVLGFISDFGSLATYAGLITAGVAVALQAVILSVAAYFFLVGRYGVRVGDRVTVVYNASNSVTGDVVDIGLVRFYMMEMAANGIDMQPTGRICAFPNSVLFQTNPLFKQLPGTEYAWREIALPLHLEADGKLAEKELLAAVHRLYDEYQPLLERQHRLVESSMDIHLEIPRPYTRVRFSGTGIEVSVRYPVPLRQAGELDDRIVTEVAGMLEKNPTIQLATGAGPELRSPVRG